MVPPRSWRTLASRCLAGIVLSVQVYDQLDGVMVRVSRDAYLVDHVLDQEQPPPPRRLHALQLGLQVWHLCGVRARWRAATPVDDAHQEAFLQEPYLDLDRDFGYVPVAVFHGVHRRLGHGGLESLQGLLRQSQPAHRSSYLFHRPTLVAALAGKAKVGQDSPVVVIARCIQSQRALVITHADLRSLQGYQGDVVLLIPILAGKAGELGEEEIDKGRVT